MPATHRQRSAPRTYVRCILAALLALAVAPLAAPPLAAQAPAIAAPGDSVRRDSLYRLTPSGLQRYTRTTRALAKLIRRDPGTLAFAQPGSPAVVRAYATGGMSQSEYLAFHQTVELASQLGGLLGLGDIAAATGQPSLSAFSDLSAMSPALRANVKFLSRHKAQLAAIGEDEALVFGTNLDEGDDHPVGGPRPPR